MLKNGAGMRRGIGRTRTRAAPKGLWLWSPLAQYLLHHKHALSILIASYADGAMSTSDVIRSVRGHPAAVIETVRGLESLGILRRVPAVHSRRVVEIRLTLKGLQLMDTTLARWGDLIRKWDCVPVGPRRVSVSERKG